MKRAANWAVKRAQGIPGIRAYSRTLHQRRREAHAGALPALDPRDASLVGTLERDAICAVPIEDLGWPATGALLEQLDLIAETLNAAHPASGNHVGTAFSELSAFPVVRDWGLSQRALAVAETYLGLPVFYSGTRVRRELCNGRVSGVRQWHLDAEDHRVLKMILYLGDVRPGGGPFEYVPMSQTEAALRQLKYNAGLVSDERLAVAGFGSEARVQALYPRHTAVFVDAARLLHRAQPPQVAERLTATFCWISVYGQRDHHPYGRVVTEITEHELAAPTDGFPEPVCLQAS